MNDDDLEQRAKARIGRGLADKYVLETLLGIGGMAAVYSARHRNGHRVAVKMLHAEMARDEDLRARFLREGYAANKVEHPGTVQVIDDDFVREGEDAGAAYLVMELLEGESVLSRARARGTLAESEVLAIAEGVLDVLIAAHARGIIHRDLKPDNLFLVPRPGGELLKVLDFGIARIADSVARTKVGTTLGTPSYMAPEQARGGRDGVDGRADLFALGATMFRLLTARRIHEGSNSTEILAKMATLPAPPIRTIGEGISSPMAAIVDRALRFERELRYADAAAMRDDVRAARAGERLPSGSVPADESRSAASFSAGSDITGIGAFAPVVQEGTVATLAAKPGVATADTEDAGSAYRRALAAANLERASTPAAIAVSGSATTAAALPVTAIPATASSAFVNAPTSSAPQVTVALPPTNVYPPTASASQFAVAAPSSQRSAEKKSVPVALFAAAGAFAVLLVGVALFVVFHHGDPPRAVDEAAAAHEGDQPAEHDEATEKKAEKKSDEPAEPDESSENAGGDPTPKPAGAGAKVLPKVSPSPTPTGKTTGPTAAPTTAPPPTAPTAAKTAAPVATIAPPPAGPPGKGKGKKK